MGRPGRVSVWRCPPLPFPGQPGFVVPAPEDRPRFDRRAVRVLVLDEADRMLLFLDSDLGLDPVTHWWVTPGGGVDPGESDLEAAVRELWEETGLVVDAGDLVGPLLTRAVVHGYSDKVVDQVEVFYVVRVPAFEVDTTAHTEEEQLTVADIRWWSLADLATTTTTCGRATCWRCSSSRHTRSSGATGRCGRRPSRSRASPPRDRLARWMRRRRRGGTSGPARGGALEGRGAGRA